MTEAAFELDLVGRTIDRLRREIRESDVPSIVPGLQLGDSTPKRLPAIVVFLVGDDATESVAPEAGAFQRVTASLAIVHVIGAPNTPQGRAGPAVDPMARFVGRTRGIVNGWRPQDRAGRRNTMAFRRGRLVDVADGRVIWQDEYQVNWRAQRVQEGVN